MPYTISDYKTADETLRVNDLRQALYDAGAILMEKVLVNLHGKSTRLDVPWKPGFSDRTTSAGMKRRSTPRPCRNNWPLPGSWQGRPG